jgi:phosphoribosylformimino-5-aminoimidazole carboxamide ribonucleotide (ProFAR) isomerase
MLEKYYPGSDRSDLETLSELNMYGVVVGKAYYEERLPLEEMVNCSA